MKFKEFLNESPRIEPEVKNKPNEVSEIYDEIYESEDPVDKWKFDKYTVEQYEYLRTNYMFLIKEEKNGLYMTKTVLLYCKFDMNKYDNLGKMYRNTLIQKASGIGTFTIVDFMFAIIDHYKLDGIISDKVQSYGGMSLWKKILLEGYAKDYEIGAYYDGKRYDHIGEDDDFDEWYEKIKKNYDYGYKAENYLIYVKK